ncbi:MAG: hypothetical protein R2752_16880 [Vicinamibacterales bacterium]
MAIEERTTTMKKNADSFVVNGLLAGAVLYWVIDLSGTEPGRTFIDYAVIGLVASAVLWNIVNLGLRLHRIGGGREVWHLQRTLLFVAIGLMNTVFARPEQTGTWRFWVGGAMLVLAAADVVALYRVEWRGGRGDGGDRTGTDPANRDPADDHVPALPR